MTIKVSYELELYPLEGVENKSYPNDEQKFKDSYWNTKRLIERKTKEKCRLLFIYQGIMFFEKIESVKESEE